MTYSSGGIYKSLGRLSPSKVIDYLKKNSPKYLVVSEALLDTEPLAYNSKHIPTTEESMRHELMKEGYHSRIVPVAFLGDALPERRYMVFLAKAFVIAQDEAQIEWIKKTSKDMADHGAAGMTPWESDVCSADNFLVKDGLFVKAGQFMRNVGKLLP